MMNRPAAQKRNIRWGSSSHAPPRPPRPRSKRRFALVAVTSTLVACGAAVGLAVLGMKHRTGEQVAGSAHTVRSAAARSGVATDSRMEPAGSRTAPRLETVAKEDSRQAGRTGSQPAATHRPRWEETFAAADPAASRESRALKRKLLALGRAHAGSGPAFATVPGQASYAEIAAPETPEEIAAIEAIVVPDEKEQLRADKEEKEPAPAVVSWDAEASNMKQASASEAVRLRAQPGTYAKILTVVPEGATIRASGDCSSWCAVSYDGRHGWIFKDYVRFGQSTAARNDGGAPAEQDAQSDAAEAKPLPAPTHASTMLERTRRSR